jgi:hypothetical protein
MAIAIRQRAKFEGWLKFELAAHAEAKGMNDVTVELAATEAMRSRADVTFWLGGERYNVELKTCNTNWRMEGVREATRPITKNIAGIIQDATKLQTCTGRGIVAVCMFPVNNRDTRWTEYLERISTETGIELSVERNSTRVSIPIGSSCKADVVVISFAVPKAASKAVPVAAGAL